MGEFLFLSLRSLMGNIPGTLLDRQLYCDLSWQLRQLVRHRRPSYIGV